MVYCFDTSAINKLLDDPDRDAIVTGLLGTNTVRPTAINAMEICKNTDRDRLRSLMRLLYRLSNWTLPLEAPNALLIELARTHLAGKHDVTVTLADERLDLWYVMQEPDSLTDARRQEVVRWTSDVESGFQAMHDNARAEIQAAAKDYLRPRSGAKVIRTHTFEWL